MPGLNGMKNGSRVFGKALKDTVPVLSGYIVLGIGFGVLLSAQGYGIMWAFWMAVFMYAGSMQYLAVSLLSGNADFVTIALGTLLVNGRHLLYGISMVDKYKVLGRWKWYAAFALTDETYSLVCMDTEGVEKQDLKRYYLYVSALDHLYWITGCVSGAILGTYMDFNSEGIEFALTALFVTVVTEQWLSTKDHFAAVLGFVSTLLCLLLFGSTSFLIPSMAVIAAVLLLKRQTDMRKNGIKQSMREWVESDGSAEEATGEMTGESVQRHNGSEVGYDG